MIRCFKLMLTGCLFLSSICYGDEPLTFTRTHQKGDRYTVAIQYIHVWETYNNNWMPTDTSPVDNRFEMKISMSGIATVTAIDKANQAQTIVVEIEEFNATDDYNELNFAVKETAKQKLILERDGNRISITKSPFRESHNMVLSERLSDGLVPIFGIVLQQYTDVESIPDNKTWPVAIDDDYCKSLSELGGCQLLDDSFVTGTVKLLGKSRLSGTECYDINAHTKAKDRGVVGEAGEFPQKFSFDVNEDYRFLFPVDPKSCFHRSRRERSSTMKAVHTEKSVAGYESTMKQSESIETFVSPIELNLKDRR